MRDITDRLRDLYVNTGANYVQEAANEIERLRDKIDQLMDERQGVPSIPEGYQLVPVEPTMEMIRATDYLDGSEYVSAGKIYRVMLAAAKDQKC